MKFNLSKIADENLRTHFDDVQTKFITKGPSLDFMNKGKCKSKYGNQAKTLFENDESIGEVTEVTEGLREEPHERNKLNIELNGARNSK